MITTFAIVAALLQQTGWKPVTELHAMGAEQLMGGSKRDFEVTVKDGSIVVDMAQALDGHLSGVPRREVRSSDGVFTWLPSRPGWVLQRAASTAGDYTSMFAPPTFSPQDLRKGATWLKSRFGLNVRIDRPQKVAGRFCDVLHFSERSASVKTVWIDQETGLTLRYQEATGDQVIVDRTVTELQLATGNAPAKRPNDSRIIKGIPSGGVLERIDAPRSEKEYAADMESVQKGSRLGHGAWVKRLPTLPGFDYAVTEWKESLGSLAPKKPDSNQGTVEVAGGEIVFATSGDQEKIALLSAISQSGTMEVKGVSLTFTAVDVDGPILKQESAAGASAFLQSDFVNRQTGDTVSFLQIRNASLAAAMKGVKLPQPAVETDKQLGEIKVYEVRQPWTMTVVCWTAPTGLYALVSTSHSAKDLIELAKKIG